MRCVTVLLLVTWYGMYSTLVMAPVPVGTSMLVISRQIRWPALNWLAVARISIRYSATSPGLSGAIASRVSLWKGFHGVERFSSSARYEALSQPRVSSRSGRSDGLQHDDPVGVFLVDRCVQRERDGAGDGDVVRERLRHVAKALDLRGASDRHLREHVRLECRCAEHRRGTRLLGGQAFPVREVELLPLSLDQRPFCAGAPFV